MKNKRHRPVYEKAFDLLYLTALLAGNPIIKAFKLANKAATRYVASQNAKKQK